MCIRETCLSPGSQTLPSRLARSGVARVGHICDHLLLRRVPVEADSLDWGNTPASTGYSLVHGDRSMSTPSALRLRTPRRHIDDVALFDQWVEEHGSDLYRLAYRLCGDKGAGEDLVQEAFFEVWKYRKPLRSIHEPRAWLFVILRRRYLRMRRAEQRRPWLVSLAADQESVAAPGSSRAQQEGSDTLQPALDSMSDLFKMPLLMVFVQGLTCAQTADLLDIPLGTVLSRIHRAKQHLRELMQGEERRLSPVSQEAGAQGMSKSLPNLRIGGSS